MARTSTDCFAKNLKDSAVRFFIFGGEYLQHREGLVGWADRKDESSSHRRFATARSARVATSWRATPPSAESQRADLRSRPPQAP
jgi:hypothetical protein